MTIIFVGVDIGSALLLGATEPKPKPSMKRGGWCVCLCVRVCVRAHVCVCLCVQNPSWGEGLRSFGYLLRPPALLPCDAHTNSSVRERQVNIAKEDTEPTVAVPRQMFLQLKSHQFNAVRSNFYILFVTVIDTTRPGAIILFKCLRFETVHLRNR